MKTVHPSSNRRTVRPPRIRPSSVVAAALVLGAAGIAPAQVAPATGAAPPDDTPSIKVGALIFTDYTFQQMPSVKDSDGYSVQLNSFNVSRSYINVTGNVSHVVGFRITPDVTRESGTGSSLNGSLTFRLKYAFAQFNLDDWIWKGSWIRMGIQQTPFIDYADGIYRYRFQGPIFPDRAGYLSSSDAGLSLHTAFPMDHGDLHVGVYNGESYGGAEANDRKAIQLRGTVRPFPRHPILRGWRLTGFYLTDDYVAKAERKRAILDTTFEHRYLSAGFDYLDTKDLKSAAPGSTDLHGKGWSAWATPKYPMANGSSIEALLRYDRMEPNHEVATVGGGTVAGEGVDERAIGGLAYWFPHKGSASAALMLDIESVRFSDYATDKPTQQRVALHGQISF